MGTGTATMRATWRGLRALVILGIVLAMLALNVATLTWSSLNTLASALIGAVTTLEPVSDRNLRAKEAAEREVLDERARANRARADADGLRADRNRLSVDLDAAERRVVAAENSAAAALRRADRFEREASELAAERLVDWRGRSRPVREVVREVTGSVSDRTARVAATNLGSMPGESIPFYGVAIVVAATAYELKSSCESMREIHELEVALGLAAANDRQVGEVCGMQMQTPTKEEIWAMIKSSPRTVWDSTLAVLQRAGGSIAGLPAPDFGGIWRRFISLFDGWF